MKRVQLFEFEDFNWFPNSFRIAMTKLLVVLHKMMGMAPVLAHLIQDALKQSNSRQIVDLGSGAGGSMPLVMDEIGATEQFKNVDMLLTDLYPNKDAIAEIEKLGNPHLQYHEESVNATQLDHAPKGLKTMVNSFHHMNPTMARSILESAYVNKEPILIYEMAENNIPTLIWWMLLPISLVITFIMALVMTPFVKGLTIQQLFFTYLIPVIPLSYAWDGQASLPRMYTFSDLDELLNGLEDESYTWTKAPAKKPNGKKLGYYLMGMPTQTQ